MGIAPYKSFIFDGESSIDYGVYLTGEGVFNAPERAVEMITIPNRNGAYALDQGRFENIEITYRAGMVDVDESNFAQKVEAFRNWICSKVGYCRLEDDYNPNEYRMAIYKAGIEVDHTFLIAGEFDITFECKPQRWLKSGETLELVTNGGTIDNPTNFKASPLLAVKGYGDIDLGGNTLTVNDAVFGNLYVADGDSWTTTKTYTIEPDTVNNGDAFSVSGSFGCRIGNNMTMSYVGNITDSNSSFDSSVSSWEAILTPSFSYTARLTTEFNCQFTIGTNSTKTNTATVVVVALAPVVGDVTYTITQTIQYVAADNEIIVTETGTATPSVAGLSGFVDSENGVATIVVQSTASVLGDPTYIDCDIGECYRILLSGNLYLLNNVVDFGSDLPVLEQGVNTITYDNTITELKIASRCWQL